jgi:hypothetical protein
MKHKLFLSILFIFIIPSFISGQNENHRNDLPVGFDGITFGMNVEEVKDLLKKSRNFNYREAEVTFTPDREKKVLESDGLSFLERGIFQFRDEALYIIILHIDAGRIGYFTMYQTLTEKYGNPDRLSPDQSEWESEEVVMTLEKSEPVTIKYVYRPVYQEILDESGVEDSLEELSRSLFLDQF